MKRIVHKSIFIILSCIFWLPFHAYAEGELIPDYYEEAGIPDSRSLLNQNANEYIDPFSGTLNLQHVDLVVPGNGGLDIKIQRSYANIHDTQTGALGLRTPYGLGWIMHFGRVIMSPRVDVCTQDSTNSLDNPILELPDGSRQILFYADVGTGSSSNLYITKQRWKAVCREYYVNSDRHNGLEVWSPEGLKYDMAWLNAGSSSNALYVTRITDRNGNYININYENIDTTGHTLINNITSNDGRLVTYAYTERTTNRVRLNTITANSQTWRYNFSTVGVDDHYYLSSVTRPDNNTFWRYGYKTTSGAGQYSINKLTYPTGGDIFYTYAYEQLGPILDTRQTTSISAKNSSDNGAWTYSYTPDSAYDRTSVTTPNGTIEYRHFGARAATASDSLWKVGLLLEKRIGSEQVETYTWGSQLISYEDYTRPTRVLSIAFDTEIYAPVLTKKVINRDGTNYTSSFPLLNYDGYGNPGRIVETGNAALTRTNTYYTNEPKWIIRELDKETLSGISGFVDIDRTFDSYGNIKSVNRYGALTNYTYTNTSTSKGDVASITDPESKRTAYTNYKNGIARTETQLEGVSIYRSVNNTGTVASITNGEGKTTYFGYDKLNRVDSITRPTNSAASITYTATRRTLTRGAYSETADYDGFGRPTKITKGGGGDTSVVTIRYNALGQKVFESYPSLSASSAVGITYSYDALGRIKSTAFSWGGNITYTYKPDNVVTVNDQRENETTYTYRSFGDPDTKELMKIESPESIKTTITRNNLGQLDTVTQGSKTRRYGYDLKHYLTSIDNPETNITIYGRDNIGNMKTRKVGSSGTTIFTYDGLHRLKTINYPGATTPDVTYTYYKTSNLKTVSSSAATRTYTYDGNDNLQTEQLTIGAQNYSLTYGISTLDHVDSVTYPSGRTVNYYTNPKGRQTQVSPFITNIAYYPNGQPQSMQYANGILTQLDQNNRQWLSGISSPINGGAIDLTYSYDNNGNVKIITDNVNTSYTREMSYDNVDRLETASGIWGAGTISYVAGGSNIKTMNVGGRSINYVYDATKNRLASTNGGVNKSFSYDLYGNISGDSVNAFIFDDASNLKKVSRSGSDIADFQYDGNQSMVSKTEGGQTVHLFYNQRGDLMGEYTPTGQMLKENAYLANKLVAVVENLAVIPPNLNVPSVDYDGNYTVSWVPSATSSTQYELLESASPDFSQAVLVYQGPGLSKTFSGKGNGEYFYWIRACEGSPLACGIYSTSTNSISVELPPGVPSSILVPALDTDGTYSISWGSASGTLTHYELYEATDSVFSDETLAAYTTSLSQVLSNRGSNRYYYRVRACYKTGCSNYRVGLNNLDVNIPIGIPSSITVPASDQDGTYNISWGVATGGPTYYEIYEANNTLYNGETLVAQVSTTTTTITGKANGTYYYRVRGCSPFVCGDFIEELVGVVVDIQPPSTPLTLSVPTENYSGNYIIGWGVSTGEVVRYELYESTDATFVSQTLVYQGLGFATTLTGKATANATYYYRLRACSAVLCSNYTAGPNGVVVRIAPNIPGTVSIPSADDDGRYTVSWGAATGQLTHYNLEGATTKNFVKDPSNTFQSTTGLSVSITGMVNGNYFYRIQACNGSACSDYSFSARFVAVNIPIDQPSYINVPSTDYSGSYTVDWGAVGISFTRYELYEATDAAFTTQQLIYSGTSRSRVLNKQADGIFYYRVRACNGATCYGYRTSENSMAETIVSTRAALMSIITNLLLN